MSQVVLTVPHLTLSDQVTIILIVSALLTSVVIEVYSRHYTKKQVAKFGLDAEKLAKSWVALLLIGVSAVFTGLGYLLVLAPSYTSYLTTLPFVGKHVMAVVGIATSVYMIRGQKWFATWAARLSKWSGGKNPVTEIQAAVVPQPVAAPDPNELVV